METCTNNHPHLILAANSDEELPPNLTLWTLQYKLLPNFNDSLFLELLLITTVLRLSHCFDHSVCTCCVGGRTVAQLVADCAGKVAAEGRLGHVQRRSIFGDSSHCVVDSDSLVEPTEVGVCSPGLATEQRGMRYVDAHWDVVHRLCKDTKPPAGWDWKEGKWGGMLSRKRLSVKSSAHGSSRGSVKKNHGRRLKLSGETGWDSGTVMRQGSRL